MKSFQCSCNYWKGFKRFGSNCPACGTDVRLRPPTNYSDKVEIYTLLINAIDKIRPSANYPVSLLSLKAKYYAARFACQMLLKTKHCYSKPHIYKIAQG